MTDDPKQDLIQRWIRRLYVAVVQLTWPTLMAILAAHFLLAWLLLELADEPDLTAPGHFFYFYFVTLSTVGFGDLSPVTLGGRLITVLWIIPGGLALFTTILAKLVDTASSILRRKMTGDADYSAQQDHVVVLGIRDGFTDKILDNILADDDPRTGTVVLATKRQIVNPRPDELLFVRGTQLTDTDLLRRAGIATAARIAVIGADDHEALHLALVVAREAKNPDAHIVAFFEDAATADLLEEYSSVVEATVATTADSVARALMDPGSSLLHERLVSTLEGQTQYSFVAPREIEGVSFGQLLRHLKAENHAILLAVAKTRQGQGLRINPPADRALVPGEILFYVCDRRLDPATIDWSRAAKA